MLCKGIERKGTYAESLDIGFNLVSKSLILDLSVRQRSTLDNFLRVRVSELDLGAVRKEGTLISILSCAVD